MPSLRSLVETISRNRVLLRHLPRDLNGAPIYVSPDSSLSHWKPRLHSDLFDLAREFVHVGDTIWDIGANVGLFAIAAAQKAGPAGSILAFEPDLWLVSLLERSIALQRPAAAPIHILPVAVSNAAGLQSFHIAKRGRSSNHLSSITPHSQTGGIRATRQVLSITLDWLLEHTPPPALVKLDVEGSELDLYEGAHRLLTEIRPILMCESQHRNRPAVTTVLRRYNYRLYEWGTSPRVELEMAAFNTLAIPD